MTDLPTAAPPSDLPLAHAVGRRAAADRPRVRAAALLGVGALAGTAFGVVAVASARHATVPSDERLHAEMRDGLDETPTGKAAEAVAPVAEQAALWWVYVPAALAASGAVLAAPERLGHTRRGRRAGAAAIASVPALAAALSPAFDRWLPQPPVGPRRRPVDHPVFPSGHAFRAAAVALVAGYVVGREELVEPGRAASLAASVPAAVGLGRLVREKHLASDVLGGWLAGAALAALAAAAYELTRVPRGARLGGP